MPKQYKENEIVKKIESAILVNQLSTLYKKPYIKRKGSTKDTKKLYSEVVSKKLLDSKIRQLFSNKCQIKKIPRVSYRVRHTGTISEGSNRNEENLAKKLKDKQIEHLGTILEYQIPLKSKRDKDNEGVGKIDLVSVNHSENKAFIIELKAEGNPEGLLKAILEIVTYSYQLNEDQFLKDFSIPYRPITKSILLEKGPRSQGYKEACELENRPNLKELIRSLGVEIFLLKDRKNYTVEHIEI